MGSDSNRPIIFLPSTSRPDPSRLFDYFYECMSRINSLEILPARHRYLFLGFSLVRACTVRLRLVALGPLPS